MKSKLSFKAFAIDISVEIVWRIIVAVIGALIALIPIIGWVIAIIIELSMFFSLISFLFKLIGQLMSHVEITESHVRGKAGLKRFELTLEQVAEIEKSSNKLTIYKAGKTKPYIIDNIANENELLGEFRRVTGRGRDLDQEAEAEAERKKAEKEAKKKKKN